MVDEILDFTFLTWLAWDCARDASTPRGTFARTTDVFQAYLESPIDAPQEILFVNRNETVGD